ncbi:MAG: GDSL-type esterase/lipase family protein [Prosthecobacter sp.]|uniref:GDSL-type esterase/lipase family protein n=1 Tax=Prosthecobacter sp. TaxID=1965333 RepID=UPI0038FDB3BE
MTSRWIYLSGVFLISAVQAAEHFWDEIPLSASTTRPSKVQDDYWNSQFLRVNREVAAAQETRLIFFGDSITWSWSLGPATGRDVWADQFAAYNPINMGNSGDITPVMLHRVTRGNLDFPAGRQPKVAVVLCGINNFIVSKSDGGKETWALGINCPPEDIAEGQRAIAQVFRRRLPQTRVIMMALLPVADKAKWEKCQRVNAINASLARDPNQVAYLDLQDRFLLPDGTINRALFTDGIHLSKEGYQAWAKGIAPLIEKFMKAPPLTPVKIMLIGGSATEGLDSNSSYRRYLDGMLRRSGHLIDFVGSRNKHNNDSTEPGSYEFDPDHEGHWGKDSTWIAENMPRLLERNVPDVAVIHLGVEDIDANQTPDGIVQNIDRVIQALGSKNQRVKIVIAKVPPVEGKEETSVLLNQRISQLASSSASVLQPVVAAETNQRVGDAAKTAAMLTKALHPLLATLQDLPSK